MSPKDKIPLKQAFLTVILSVVICFGIPLSIIKIIGYKKHLKQIDEKFQILFLAQTGPVKESVKTEHLVELLQLSKDCPENIWAYSTKQGEEHLLRSGIIQSVNIYKEAPSTLRVDYTTREPVAYISDYENLVVDQSGFIFPLTPYFTPKNLPKVYLGVAFLEDPVGLFVDEKWKISKDILSFLQGLKIKGQSIDLIDVSKLRASSLGRREIIVRLFEELGQQKYERVLRLSTENYIDEISHYLSLKQMSFLQDMVVDLRLLPNAYLTPIEEKA